MALKYVQLPDPLTHEDWKVSEDLYARMYRSFGEEATNKAICKMKDTLSLLTHQP